MTESMDQRIRHIPLTNPILDTEMVDAAVHAMKSERFVLGESVFKFEEEFARFCGTKYGISTASGTAALILSLLAIDVSQSEVITSTASFVASANSIIHAGATPRFADANLEDYTIDPAGVASAITKKTKAVVPVHLYGYPAAMDQLRSVASDNNLAIVEDACQAHGATIDGRKAGSIGTVGCFSFYPTKNMTVAGDGGMIVTNDKSIAETVTSLRDCGRAEGIRYRHTRFGFTERLNTVQAAIGRVQLRKLEVWNQKRTSIAKLYDSLLSNIGEVKTPPKGNNRINPVYHLYVIRASERDKLREWLRSRGIEGAIHYPDPIHLQPIYRETFGYKEGKFPNSEKLCKEVLSLPIFPTMTDSDVEYVSASIQEFYKKAD